MPEITFVFGPNNTFFFDCPQTWKFHGIPTTFRQLFQSTMAPAWRIAQPYCVALAPAINAPEPMWYVGCKTMSGENKLFYSQTHFEANYGDLARWTRQIHNAPQLCFVTFGQNRSYFACAPGHGSIWAGLPSDLEDKLRKTTDTPSCVALGAKNTWFVLYPDGALAWNFHSYYHGLDKILKTAAPNSISYIALSPYHKEHYFVAFRDRSIKYNFTGAPSDWMKLMTEVFDAWAQERIQKQVPPPPQQQQPFYPANPYGAPQPYGQPPFNPMQQPYYAQNQPYPAPPYAPPQQGFNTFAQSQPQIPTSPTAFPSPAPAYSSPVVAPAAPASAPPAVYGYSAPPAGAIEMPAELPASMVSGANGPAPPESPAPSLVVPVSGGDGARGLPGGVPARSISTEKKRKFLSRLW